MTPLSQTPQTPNTIFEGAMTHLFNAWPTILPFLIPLICPGQTRMQLLLACLGVALPYAWRWWRGRFTDAKRT
jgi:hypothetical protein